MRQHTWVFLFISLYSAQNDAMVHTRDVTRLPNCYDIKFAQMVARQTLHTEQINYELASIKLISVSKTTYKEFPETYLCQGIIDYRQNGKHISNVFIYRIGWANNVVRKLQVKSALYPIKRMGS